MSLRLRVILILTGLWIVLSLLVYAGSRTLLTSRLENMEKASVVSDVMRAEQALESLEQSLYLLTSNWGLWDDAWAFMNQKNDTFAQENLLAPAFQNAGLNLILFFDKAGNFYSGRAFSLSQKQFVNVPASLLSRVKSGIFSKALTGKSFQSGLLKLPEGFLVFSTSPVLKSDGRGESNGMLLMGFYVRQRHIQALSERLKMPLYLYSLPLRRNPPLFQTGYQKLSADNAAHAAVMPAGEKQAWGFGLVRDITGNPVALLGIRVPRELYHESTSTLSWHLLLGILLGLPIILTVWYLLEFFVLHRLVSISGQVVDITQKNDFSKRIHISGKDELGSMVTSLNKMLEIIQLTEEQLKARINQRTGTLEHLSNLNNNLSREVDHYRSVSEKLHAQEKTLHQLAFYDHLTGLANRVSFHEMFGRALEKAKRNKTGVALLFLDADNFKIINDTWGHTAGDKYLRHVAEKIRSVLKNPEACGRFAGDEFVVYIENIQEKTLGSVAKRLLDTLAEPLVLNNEKISSTFSIGISIYPENGQTIDELEQAADAAMYQAKAKNGNQCCFASAPETTFPS